MSFVHLGTVWGAHNPQGTWGYDGQFYYQIAVNPLGAAPFLDNAPYRYGRILYPLVARLIALGQRAFIPWALLAVNLGAMLLSVALLSDLLQRQRLSPWYSLAYGLSFGLLAGLTFDTAEPFAYGLVCVALWCWQRGHAQYAAAAFGLAALARETTLLFVAGFLVYFLGKRMWRYLTWFLILGLVPVCTWLVVLVAIFGPTGLTFTPPFEHIPFAGIFAQLPGLRKVALLAIFVLIPTATALVLSGRDLHRATRDPILLTLLLNAVLMTFLSRDSYLDLIAAGRIGTGLVLAWVAYGTSRRSRAVLLTSFYAVPVFAVYLVGVWLGIRALLL
jgi:hypothetical protein